MPRTSFTGRLGFDVTPDLLGYQFNASAHLRLTDEITGYFRRGGFYRALAEAHQDMAFKVQQRAVDILKQEVAATGRPQLSQAPRPGREANRLSTSILAEGNRFASASGFVVGRTAWLEQSPAALYFRIIEEGGQAYTTSGFFYAPGGKAETPVSGRNTAIMLRQTINTTGKPFAFTVSATRAYNMTERAGEWFGDQHSIIYNSYYDHLTATGCPIPISLGRHST